MGNEWTRKTNSKRKWQMANLPAGKAGLHGKCQNFLKFNLPAGGLSFEF